MSNRIVLDVPDGFIDRLEAEYEQRQNRALESMEAHGWTRQAEKLEETEIIENTAEKALFVLRQEVGN